MFAILVCFTAIAAGQQASNQSFSSATTIENILEWLPADTESIVVARGPFGFPTQSKRTEEQQEAEQERQWKLPVTPREIRDLAHASPLALFSSDKASALHQLAGQKVAWAVEGSRHFRAPKDLGGMTYEGCEILILDPSVPPPSNRIMAQLETKALRVEAVAGYRVPLFKEKMEADIWTLLVANPLPNIFLVATDLGYMQELLERMKTPRQPRAFPSELPEWKYLDLSSSFWELRHFDRAQSAMDPSSPFGGQKAANEPDDEAVGQIAFIDPEQRKGRIIKVSNNTELLNRLAKQGHANPEPEMGVKLSVTYRLIAPGILECSYDLKSHADLSYFGLLLDFALGHALYM